ncbi:MAG: hypothetical protein JJLCMIEE_00950 [Acidimicrobiales bacterium]|nr:MAG: cyclic nucleotide-binding domain-containing protein [Actinomycetota bacterium]MBV6507892.1 hypothetical protein [Acidimicrobiales bacterium]RIK06035.1 MAG: hypothetical protein DCC48_08785 [Acidobacteriota bacterium]
MAVDPHLRNVPIFQDCSEAELAEITRMATQIEVEAGTTLATQGELGHEFGVIIEGEASVIKDGRKVSTLGPGDYFGEIALLDSIVRTASVVADTQVVLEVIDKRGFNTLLDDIPSLSRSLLRGVVRRCVALDDELLEIRADNG